MAEYCCESDIVQLEEELNNLKVKLRDLKLNYSELLVENLQKDIIIRQSKLKIEKNKFVSFEQYLSKRCIEKLNLIGHSPKEDSQFVAVILNDLYNEDIGIIKQKVLSIRPRAVDKSKITPKKKKF